MYAFKDTAGRSWSLTITVGDVRRVRKATDVNLSALAADGLKPLAALLSDPCKLVDVLFVLVAEQAGKLGVTDEQFGQSLAGDTLEAAADAFVAALLAFFPRRQREALADVITKAKAVQQALAEQGAVELAAIDPAKEAAKIVARFRPGSGTSPPPAPSLPAPAAVP